jgi:hypothetical protein
MMMLPPSDPNELFDLTDDLCDGVSDDATIARLESLLNADQQARHKYLEYASLHADLLLDDAELIAFATRAMASTPALELADRPMQEVDTFAPMSTENHRSPTNSRIRYGRVSSWAAKCFHIANAQWSQFRAAPVKLALFLAVMITAVFVTLMFSEFRPVDPATQQSLTSPRAILVATLTGARNCEWLEASRDVPTAVGAPIPAGSVYALRSGRVEIRFDSGATTVLYGPAEVIVSTTNSASLRSGTVTAQVPSAAVGFSITTPSVQIIDRGTEFTATVSDSGETEVKVAKGSVEVRPRSPKFYWGFDEAGGRYREQISGQAATLGRTAKATQGLVGSGAIEFNNQAGSIVYLGNSDFSVTSGLTIEAVFVSRWSGEFGDYDHIFRKEDSEERVLLAFQNPSSHREAVSMPMVPEGPCLSFGLFLKGQGYHELDMPLDGLEGRPKLKDLTNGKLHHVAAVYDATTGEKSLFVDGRRRMTTNYAPGTQIVSGGSAQAVVGSCTRWIHEVFNGVIDEVAWYDIALTDEEISEHYNFVREGKNYFGNLPEQAQSQRYQSTHLKANESMVFTPDVDKR